MSCYAEIHRPPCSTPGLSTKELTVLFSGAFAVVFDVFVVNLAIPSLQIDLGANLAESSLVVAVYALTFGSCLIIGGRLGDRHGRQRTFILGMVGFAFTSLGCGLAPTLPFLVITRLLQGMCAALLFPQIYALLHVLYDESGRARAFSILGMTLGFAAITGQLLGGMMVWINLFGLGWRLVFLVNLPFGLVIALLARTVPESHGPATRLDLLGAFLITSSLSMLLVSLLEGPTQGWPTWSIVSLISSPCIGMLFIIWEHHLKRRGNIPLINLALFTERHFSLALIAVLLVYSTPASLFLCFSMTLQNGLGVTPLMVGTLLTPMSVGFILASFAMPRLPTHFGTGTMICGLMLYTAGFLWLAWETPNLSSVALPHLSYLAGMVAFGFGQGLSGPPLLNLAIGTVAKTHAGMASGVISTAQQLGMAIGVASGGMLFTAALAAPGSTSQTEHYMQALAITLYGNALLTLIATALIVILQRLARSEKRQGA